MTTYQTIAVSIALLAFMISSGSLQRTSKTIKEQLSLQRIMAHLAQKQLEQIQEPENSAESVSLSVRVDLASSSTKTLMLKNVGEVEARDIEFEIEPPGDLKSPLVHSDYEEKFPVRVLVPGSCVAALMAVDFGTAMTFRGILRRPDRARNCHSEETYASL